MIGVRRYLGQKKKERTLRFPAVESLRDWGAHALPFGSSLLTILATGGYALFYVFSAQDPNGLVGEIAVITAGENYSTSPAGVVTSVPLDPLVYNQVILAWPPIGSRKTNWVDPTDNNQTASMVVITAS